jgi:hypothetical protein
MKVVRISDDVYDDDDEKHDKSKYIYNGSFIVVTLSLTCDVADDVAAVKPRTLPRDDTWTMKLLVHDIVNIDVTLE